MDLLPLKPLFPPPRWRACGNRKRKEKKRKGKETEKETRSRETIIQEREERDHEPPGSRQCLKWGIF
jgi:hypothetical protein